MIAYILTENDMELLKTTMEKWEAKMELEYPSTASGTEWTVRSTVLSNVRCELWRWVQRVKAG